MLIASGCARSLDMVFTRSSKLPALARAFWIHLLEVCWTFAESCKHPMIGHDVGWCRWCRTQPRPCATLSCHASGRHQGVTHGSGAWGDVSSRRQRPLILPLLLWHVGWTVNQPSNRTGVLPIEGALAQRNRLFGKHVQTIWNGSTVPASQQRGVPCIGGVSLLSYHSVAGHVGLPLRFDEDSSPGKPLSFVHSVIKRVLHPEAYSRVVGKLTTTALKIFIFVVKPMLRRFQAHSLGRAKTPDALPIQHSVSSEDATDIIESPKMEEPR